MSPKIGGITLWPEGRTNTESSETVRATWGKQIESTLSLIGFTVGLGNFWRFPYLCMRNGGGAFLVPYLTFLILGGLPLYYLELALGQFSGLSALSVWEIAPICKGIGWAMVTISIIISIYYITLMVWVIYYFGMSLRLEVPWKTCDNSWNTPNCMSLIVGMNSSAIPQNEVNGSEYIFIDNITNGTSIGEHRVSAAEEFWSRKVLNISDGIDDIGTVKWDLFLALVATWLLVWLCISRGIKSSGKAVYLTVPLPYVMITILMIRGVTLPGSLEGIKFYLIPDWSKLTSFKVWTEACIQVFYSLGPGWGGLLTISSYNKFKSNCLKSAMISTLSCGLSSFYSGFALFSVLGFMAHVAGVPVDKVVTAGPGLLFIVFPEAVSHMPLSPLWAAIFFLTLTTLGIDGQFGTLETVISGLADEYSIWLLKRKTLFGAGISFIMFLLSIPFVTEGGMYLFQIMDWYCAMFSIVLIGLMECITVCYIYGIGQFYSDLTLMSKSRPSYIWAICWGAITPLLFLTMLVVNCVSISSPSYGDYRYPAWAEALGWVIAFLSVIPIPLVAVYEFTKTKGSLKQRCIAILRPTTTWGPQHNDYRTAHRQQLRNAAWTERMDLKTVSLLEESNEKLHILM